MIQIRSIIVAVFLAVFIFSVQADRCANEGESCEQAPCCNGEGLKELTCHLNNECHPSNCITELFPFCHSNADCCPGYYCAWVTNTMSTCKKNRH